jgi:hypothetical protein
MAAHWAPAVPHNLHFSLSFTLLDESDLHIGGCSVFMHGVVLVSRNLRCGMMGGSFHHSVLLVSTWIPLLNLEYTP